VPTGKGMMGHVRTGALALALLASGAAAAQTRLSSVAMTCGQTARLILDRGAVVLGTGGQTFDRYVRDRGFCEITEIAIRSFVPTRDNPGCFIGYRCREPTTGMFDDQ
jgi:hypothetical protein